MIIDSFYFFRVDPWMVKQQKLRAARAKKLEAEKKKKYAARESEEQEEEVEAQK